MCLVWMLYCTNELPVQRCLIYWGFQVKWGSRLILRLIRTTEMIGSRETDLRRLNIITPTPTHTAYCIYHCHASIAFRPINKEKTSPCWCTALYFRLICKRSCTSSEVWLFSSISNDGAESARSGPFIYIIMSWWDRSNCKGEKTAS